MKSRVFAITSPGKIEAFERDVEPKDGEVLLRPVRTGICQSDLYYFEGTRPPEVLKRAYPLSPFHEAVVESLKKEGSPTGDFFVPIPNMSCNKQDCPACRKGGCGSNYCPNVIFASSNTDGFARTPFQYKLENIVPVPKGVPLDIACLTEPMSVAVHTTEEAALQEGMRVCTIGDGPQGLIQALASKYRGIKKEDNTLLGFHNNKLVRATEYASVKDSKQVSEQNQYDVVFECVGSKKHAVAINQGVKLLKPGGLLVVLGQSDNSQPIEFRPILKKCITIRGLVRSRTEHFVKALEILSDDFYRQQAKGIIGGTFPVTNKDDIEKAFRNRFEVGKTHLDWTPMYKNQ